ncbi:C39 family peptidase [Bacillus aerius]|uniref:C39 family peptidase n=1 Tax=Bacillus aerius TaxID=293388 RepID=UPI0028155B52|nr:C39 family peptidase [Bacillus aerius]WMT29639.1 C39 family peptidase [Bacillus aerius]
MKFIQTFILTLLCACLVYFGFIYISQFDQVKKTTSPQETKEKENDTALAEEETRSTKKTETTHSSLKGNKKAMDVILFNQMDAPKLYNGCEVTSLAMLLHYNGYEHITKNALANEIKRVPLNYENGLKGDPHDGFVGDMENGPGLGVYHEPIYQLAKKYVGNQAVDLTGKPVKKAIYQSLEKGYPVWVITTSTFAKTDNIETWNTPNGKIDISFNMHSVVVTGYDKDHVYLNNPYGEKNQKVDREQFEDSWKQMGSQAIIIKA